MLNEKQCVWHVGEVLGHVLAALHLTNGPLGPLSVKVNSVPSDLQFYKSHSSLPQSAISL